MNEEAENMGWTNGPATDSARALRLRAEKEAGEKSAGMPENLESLTPEKLGRLIHELRVHQIELEMQNEELRRAHEELDVSRALYSDLYDLAPVGYITLSQKGLILQANLTMADLIGEARCALANQPLSRFIFSEDQDVYYRHHKQLFETCMPQTCEIRMARKDGALFWVRMDAVRDSNNAHAPECKATLIDISARKLAENRLAQSSQYWQDCFAAIEDMIVIIDRDRRVIQANEAAQAGLVESGGIIKQHCFEAFHGKDAILPSCPSCDVFDTGKPTHYEVKEKHLGDRWFDFYAYPIKDDGNRVNLVVHVVRDITKRRQTEDALKQSEEMHRILFESSNDAIMTLEPPSWKFAKGNSAAIALFGARDEMEFVSLDPAALSPEKQPDGRFSKEKSKEMIETAMRGGQNYFEWTHKKINGEEFPASVLLARMFFNERAFIQATVRDISHLKKEEKDKESLRQQLVQSQKLESIGQLAGGIAHDFNNMLAVIMGNANLMQLTLKPEDKGYEEFMDIAAAAERARELTMKLLTFSRKEKLNVCDTEIAGIVKSVEGMLFRSIDKNIKIVTKIKPGIITGSG